MKVRKSRSEVEAIVSRLVKSGLTLETKTSASFVLVSNSKRVEIKITPNSWVEILITDRNV